MHILCKLGFHKWKPLLALAPSFSNTICDRCGQRAYSSKHIPPPPRPAKCPPAPPLMRNDYGVRLPSFNQPAPSPLLALGKKMLENSELNHELTEVKRKLELAQKIGMALSSTLGRVVAERDELFAKSKTSIELSPEEIQSGLDRVRWAEGLILQLPEDHNGRNSWLLNYGKTQ